MLVWRITRQSHQALDVEGARLHGGRWNSEGLAVVYASATLALAALEYLVHLNPEDAPADLVAMSIELPDDASEERTQASELPADWNEVPDHPECRRRGDAWVKDGRSLLLRVPSSIVPEEANVLINPRHAEAGGVAIRNVRPFAFDPRLLG